MSASDDRHDRESSQGEHPPACDAGALVDAVRELGHRATAILETLALVEIVKRTTTAFTHEQTSGETSAHAVTLTFERASDAHALLAAVRFLIRPASPTA